MQITRDFKNSEIIYEGEDVSNFLSKKPKKKELNDILLSLCRQYSNLQFYNEIFYKTKLDHYFDMIEPYFILGMQNKINKVCKECMETDNLKEYLIYLEKETLIYNLVRADYASENHYRFNFKLEGLFFIKYYNVLFIEDKRGFIISNVYIEKKDRKLYYIHETGKVKYSLDTIEYNTNKRPTIFPLKEVLNEIYDNCLFPNDKGKYYVELGFTLNVPIERILPDKVNPRVYITPQFHASIKAYFFNKNRVIVKCYVDHSFPFADCHKESLKKCIDLTKKEIILLESRLKMLLEESQND